MIVPIWNEIISRVFNISHSLIYLCNQYKPWKSFKKSNAVGVIGRGVLPILKHEEVKNAK